MFLDLMRGVAALLVLCEHWRNFIFVDYPQIRVHRAFLAIPYLLASAGHQAVIIFFIMSGYLISGSVFRMFERGSWSWRTYLTHRLVRLWVVLIPGLLLGAFWDHMGLTLHLAPALYHGASGNHMTPDVSASVNSNVLISNLLFLQTIVTPTYGSNGALWSLANEFWYYILFPLGLLATRTTSRFSVRILSGSIFLAVCLFLRGGILQLFPIWLAGTLLVLIPTLRIKNSARTIALSIYVPIFFLFSKFPIHSTLVKDYALAFITFLFLWILLSATKPAQPSRLSVMSFNLAQFSYTLYIVHMPFLLFLTAFFLGDQRWQPNFENSTKAGIIFALAICYAYGIAALTELKTDDVRRWIEARLAVNKNV